MKHILTIDQSTSGTKVLFFNEEGKMSHRITELHEQKYPMPGRVEHDPEEILRNTRRGIKRLLEQSKVDRENIAALALTNQRETIFVWDVETGKSLHNALVWQDQRGTDICKRLAEHTSLIREKTGLVLDPFFSASKLTWLMENNGELRRRASEGKAMCGTSDSWLIWNLTGGKVHATDYTNASRTMLFNIHTLEWDRELLKIFGLESLLFPQVLSSDAVFGHLSETEELPNLPITGVMGDSHAALFGHRGFHTGEAKVTYGTGSSVMLNIGTVIKDAGQEARETREARSSRDGAADVQDSKKPARGFVTSIGWGYQDKVVYVFEGNIHSTGDTVRWVKENLGLFDDFDEASKACEGLGDNGGVYLVPAFAGLGAPYWKHGIRAMISGLSRGSDRRHIIRAAYESIAYQIADLIQNMRYYLDNDIRHLNVDGGPTNNSFLMQFQADVLNKEITVPDTEEISARGSAYMAGLTVGVWPDPEALGRLVEKTTLYRPTMDSDIRSSNIEGWKEAVRLLIGS